MEKESKKRLIKYVVLIPIAIVFGYFIFITARNEISNIYYKKGLEKADKEAIADFNTAIKVNPHNIAAYIEKAKRLGKTMEALTILNAAIEICPSINDTTYIGSKNYRYNGYDYSFNSLYSMRARLYISLNKYDNAIEDYTRMTNFPNDYGISGYYNRGYVYYLKEEYEKAELDFKKIISICNQFNLQPKRGDIGGTDNIARLFLCVLDYKRGKYITALKYLSDSKYPESITSLYKATILAKTGDFKNSISNYETYFKNNNYLSHDLTHTFIDNFPTPFIVDNECAANACVNLHKYDFAISLDPSNANAYLGKGVQLYENKNYEQAITELTKAIDINPTLNDAYIKRGISKYNLKDYDGAVSDLSNLDLKKDFDAYCSRSFSYHKQHNYSQAISDYDIMLTFDLKNDIKGAIYYNRGIAKQSSGLELDGVSDLNIARGLGYKNADDLLNKHRY